MLVAEPDRKSPAQYGQYIGMGLLLPASTFVGYVVGYLLDRAFHTRFLAVVFLILGTLGGLVELIRQLTRDSGDGR